MILRCVLLATSAVHCQASLRRVSRLQLTTELTAAPEAGRPADSSAGSVVVSEESFEKSIKGRKFEKWQDFKEAAGDQSKLPSNDSAAAKIAGAEQQLTGGLSLAFVVILNALVWCIVFYIIAQMAYWSERSAVWAGFVILCVYAFTVNACCWELYEDPDMRLITNFLFGLVPLAVSSASYLFALLVLDIVKLLTLEDGGKGSLLEGMNPFQQILVGRLVFFLAVIPGLATSLYLSSEVSTGFTSGAAHFDVLSLCLFIDSGRFAGHLFYLAAPEWSIGKSPTSISSRPGVCYVVWAVCWAWFAVLACMVAGHEVPFLVTDETKTHTLLVLTCVVFVPLSMYLDYKNVGEFIDLFEESTPRLHSTCLILSLLWHALFMLFIGVVFDAIEANLIGVCLLLWVVFYTAARVCSAFHNSILGFILALVPLAGAALALLLAASRHAPELRATLLASLAPHSH